MVYYLRFFSSKCSLFHNSDVFGTCIIHILYIECAKIKIKFNSGAKSLNCKSLQRAHGIQNGGSYRGVPRLVTRKWGPR